MAKNVYIGIANLSKRVPTIYIGVANLARKVVRGYIGINNLAKEFYSSEPVLIFETKTPGTYTQSLASGLYEITLIGSGGGGLGLVVLLLIIIIMPKVELVAHYNL